VRTLYVGRNVNVLFWEEKINNLSFDVDINPFPKSSLQETLGELATLRSTLADSDEVNQYKAKELKEKELELQKLTEDLKVGS
jgi:hypothetical protein